MPSSASTAARWMPSCRSAPTSPWPVGLPAQILEQRAADPCALLRGARIRMPDQRHVAHLLQPHHAGEPPAAPIAPEHYAGADFLVHLFERHIGLLPAVRGNDAAVGSGGVVDHQADLIRISDIKG